MSCAPGAWPRVRVAACLFLSLGVCVWTAARPAPAAAGAGRTVYAEGVAGRGFSLVTPLSGNLLLAGSGGDEALGMVVGDLASYDAGSEGYGTLGVRRPDPQHVDALPGGSMLIADAANHLVAELDAVGSLVWSYTAADDPSLQTPTCAQRLDDGRTLIVDGSAARVFIVDENGALQWQYGTTGAAGSSMNELDRPTAADVVGHGDVAICDAGNHRVIVVRAADYDPAAADLGYSAPSIVWQYGTTGVAGSGVDQMATPSSVQQLTSGVNRGNMLICDSGAARVIEVRAGDYVAGASRHGFSADSLVWRYPVADGDGVAPRFALGAFGGDSTIWIADASAGAVVGVATGSSSSGGPTAHDVFARYDSAEPRFAGSLSAPCAIAMSGGNGSLVIADPGRGRVSVIGTASDSATAWSRPLSLGRREQRNLFVSITCTYATVPFAPIGISYRVDDGPWTALLDPFGGEADMTRDEGTATLLLPPLTVGKTIAYMVTMAPGFRGFAPLLTSLSITYEPRGSGSGGSGGGGDGGDRANSNGGSGTYTYPVSSGGSGQGTGGGVGGGSGSGSGSGSGRGYGSGSSGSTYGSDTGSSSGGSAGGADLPSSVDSAATAPGSGTRVAGYLMKASGFAGGGEGGGSPSVSTAHGWTLVPTGFGLVGVAVIGVAVVAERRRVKVYVDYDAARPRPFPAEHTHSAKAFALPPLVPPRSWW